MSDSQTQLQQLLNNLEGALAPEVVLLLKNATSPVAVACSGGPDSVAAALIVKAICPQPITLLHFDHRLRGQASTHDAAFVEKLAKEIGADFRLGVWERPNSQNETVARTARMKFLHQWEHELIVYGHHADDGVESLLMRLARGGRLRGLCAPHAINRLRGHLHVRPLLLLRKHQIIEALDNLHISYCQDQTNSGLDYLRNRIRHQLLPLWQQIETRDVVAGIVASQQKLRRDYARKQKLREEIRRLKALLREAGKALPASEAEADDDADSDEAAFEKETVGGLPTGYMISPAAPRAPRRVRAQPAYDLGLPLEATVFLPSGGSISARRVPAPSLEAIKAASDPRRRVWIYDASSRLRLVSRTDVRNVSTLGGTGRQQVKEILRAGFADLPPEIRAVWPMVYRGPYLQWLPGARINPTAAVPSDATHAIELNFTPPASTLSSETSSHDH